MAHVVVLNVRHASAAHVVVLNVRHASAAHVVVLNVRLASAAHVVVLSVRLAGAGHLVTVPLRAGAWARRDRPTFAIQCSRSLSGSLPADLDELKRSSHTTPLQGPPLAPLSS
ncbi:hypothetical protein [Actinoplanes sp. NPDC049599]|uniref:hypothetical protein n=1 Tax=Actinoplanes sp. NPDC049599 TaxID=3363903 RepID=UPI00379C1F6D